MKYFEVAVEAVFPFLVYLAMGRLAKAVHVADEPFLDRLNVLIFRLFFPFVMFNNVYKIDFSAAGGSGFGYILFGLAAMAAVVILSFALVPRFISDNPRRGVVIQALYRGNCVLFAIPMSLQILGSAGAEKASLLTAFIVPCYNVLAVVVLGYYRGGNVSPKKLVKNIVLNPMIMGAAAGLLFALTPLSLPKLLREPVSAIASMATPLALMTLGGTLRFSSMRRNGLLLAAVSLIRQLVIPGAVLPVLLRMGFSQEEFFANFVLLTVPVAAASYTMAANMGSDGELAGELVTVTTVLSLATLFFWIVFLQAAGILVL